MEQYTRGREPIWFDVKQEQFSPPSVQIPKSVRVKQDII